MARPGAPLRWTTRVGTLEEKETGVTALLADARNTMEGVGAPGELGAAARHPVEEGRGFEGGLALVEPVLDQHWRVSGASCKVAVIVEPGVLGDDATVFAEDEDLRAGPELAEGGIVLHRRPARAQLIALPNPFFAQTALNGGKM